eukprot:942340-Pyramimonas_sp.AAC.1
MSRNIRLRYRGVWDLFASKATTETSTPSVQCLKYQDSFPRLIRASGELWNWDARLSTGNQGVPV